MPTELFSNVASTTLAADITSGATSLTVASSSLFPTPVSGVSQFRVLVDSEYLIVTAVSGTTWTVSRGAEGSTAAAHTSGATVTHIVTAGALGSAFAAAAAAVPTGGTTGQVLAKASSTNYDATWTTVSSGGGSYGDGYTWLPSNNGLLYASFDPALVTYQGTGADNTLFLTRVLVPVGGTVSSICFAIGAAASGGASGTNVAAIYSSSGALLAQTNDLYSAWSTTGYKVCALQSAVTLSAGYVYVGGMNNEGGTIPVWVARASGTGVPAYGSVPDYGSSAGSYRGISVSTSTLPSSITISTATQNWIAANRWVALK